MKTIFKILFCFFLFFSILNCKTKAQLLKDLEDEKTKYDKYEDDYKDFKYTNKSLGLTMIFDSDWEIKAKYESFDDYQKKYTKYFSTDTGELLFVGYNKQKRIGIKCSTEQLKLTNIKFFTLLKSENTKEISDYKITFMINKDKQSDNDYTEPPMKNIKALQFIYDMKLNPSNEFRFVTILFSKNDFNYKLDIWIKKELYDDQKDYMNKILNSVDFIQAETQTDAKKDNDPKSSSQDKKPDIIIKP